ncbi:MAG: pyruvate, phosphate dikinase [Candidatus Omnitrophica bacterium]|nr:pyruvate, phosphate dikinase [Candidatus Omnitrophota bacterium]
MQTATAVRSSSKNKRSIKYVYFFGGGRAEGDAKMKNLLGGKGSNLAEMTNMGIPVPPGFTINTEACTHFYKNKKQYPAGLLDEVEKNLKKLETVMGKKFGDVQSPLLVSVRSGARVSMPGMMDTVLNLGLNDNTVKGLIMRSGSERFAYDAYRRFCQMFGDVVLGVEHEDFEHLLAKKKKQRKIKLDTELSAKDLKELVAEYKALIRKKTRAPFPEDPRKQLRMSIDAVFSSWNNKRAITYRNLNGIPHEWGTAVNVQAMVFGNLGEDSGTGVAFTRDPATGANKFYGEYLINAQGEDVVAGTRTPHPIADLRKDMPVVYAELVKIYKKLEAHYRDMQDLEFTIEDKKLYLLQTRTGKRTAQAAVKIAVDMEREGLINKREAVLRVEPEQLDQLLHPMLDPKVKVSPIAKGLPASPGAAVGKVVFTADKAEHMAEKNEKVVLVRLETSPEDIGGMAASQGILTARGGMTSHAAVVGRGMGKCCVVGCGDITVHSKDGYFVTKGKKVKEGDYISLNGNTGEVMLGELDLIEPKLTSDFRTLMVWADSFRKLGVWTNADTPHDSKVARDFGAEGIGLCRTEHMFFGKDRLPLVREMILAEDTKTRIKALSRLLPLQRKDFKGIFRVMCGLPVTIRLLDPPLHEFLPHTDKEIAEMARQMKVSKQKIADLMQNLHEINPMLGHRGCRLGITYPEIYRMQVRAIFEAACELTKSGYDVIPEVMIPLVGHVNELIFTKRHALEVATEVIKKYKVKLKYNIGTMIEIPRAAITADEIAKEADFFSFGTNDLTQMGFGFSRDDVGKFLPSYIEDGILEKDPFASIDIKGIGELVKIAVEKGRGAKPSLKIGICGEHGGDPASVEFCYKIGLNYVSCSPYRIPIARLAAAHAALKEG